MEGSPLSHMKLWAQGHRLDFDVQGHAMWHLKTLVPAREGEEHPRLSLALWAPLDGGGIGPDLGGDLVTLTTDSGVVVDLPLSALCVVKVSESYGFDAHAAAEELGIAPALVAAAELPGYRCLTAVPYVHGRKTINELLPDCNTADDREHLYAAVAELISSLHAEGFVHGDFRAPNVMLKDGTYFDGSITDLTAADMEVGDFEFSADIWTARVGPMRHPNMLPASYVAGARITCAMDCAAMWKSLGLGELSADEQHPVDRVVHSTVVGDFLRASGSPMVVASPGARLLGTRYSPADGDDDGDASPTPTVVGDSDSEGTIGG